MKTAIAVVFVFACAGGANGGGVLGAIVAGGAMLAAVALIATLGR